MRPQTARRGLTRVVGLFLCDFEFPVFGPHCSLYILRLEKAIKTVATPVKNR